MGCCHAITQLSGLGATTLADFLACNRSINSSGSAPVWKLLLSKTDALDKALDLLSNRVRITIPPYVVIYWWNYIQDVCFLSCRLWIPEILQSQWFWTPYEKSDWIHSPQTALTVLLSSSCGSTGCCFHSYLLFPRAFFLVSQQRDWIAAPTSKCKSSLP